MQQMWITNKSLFSPTHNSFKSTEKPKWFNQVICGEGGTEKVLGCYCAQDWQWRSSLIVKWTQQNMGVSIMSLLQRAGLQLCLGRLFLTTELKWEETPTVGDTLPCRENCTRVKKGGDCQHPGIILCSGAWTTGCFGLLRRWGTQTGFMS